MADMIKLSAHKRQGIKPGQMKAQGIIPAVLYGPGMDGKTSEAIEIPENAFIKAYRAAGTSTLLELDVDGEKHEVLIHNYQKHPVSSRVIHADFLAIKQGEKITASIPLNFVGESSAVKAGGILNTPIDEIEVKVLPKDLVSEIEVDISRLTDFSEMITLADLGLDPEKFEIDLEPETVIASVSEPKEEEEEEITTEGEEEMPEITGQKGELDDGSEMSDAGSETKKEEGKEDKGGDKE